MSTTATTAAAAPAAATPKHLWVVGIVTLLWNAMGAFDYLMTQTRNASYLARFSAEQLAFFTGFPAWVDASWAVAVWGGVAGSILLLLRRKAAGPVFAVALVGLIVTSIHNFGLNDGVEIMGGTGPLVFTILIFIVAVGEIAYARFLCLRNITR